jgi:hypothetical protein
VRTALAFATGTAVGATAVLFRLSHIVSNEGIDGLGQRLAQAMWERDNLA